MFLKSYIRAFQQGSDLDDTVEEKLLIGDRPKQQFDANSRPPLIQRLLEVAEDDLVEVLCPSVYAIFVQLTSYS